MKYYLRKEIKQILLGEKYKVLIIILLVSFHILIYLSFESDRKAAPTGNQNTFSKNLQKPESNQVQCTVEFIPNFFISFGGYYLKNKC